MRSLFTPEEVARIEDKAYKVGVDIGVHQERLRILKIIESQLCTCVPDCDMVDIYGPQLIELIKEKNK
jgi:hypothetical protein